MNKYKNEKLINVGGTEILLRPTFNNCASLEGDLGYGLPQLAFNLTKAKLPAMTELTKVIYHCQDVKNLNQEQVWELVMGEGVGIMAVVLEFVARITIGNKANVEEKKNLVIPNQETNLPG